MLSISNASQTKVGSDEVSADGVGMDGIRADGLGEEGMRTDGIIEVLRVCDGGPINQ